MSVSKDVNLRIKAKSIGLMAQDYKSDQIKDISALYTGKRLVDSIPGNVFKKLYEGPYELDPSEPTLEKESVAHEHYILKNDNKSALAKYDPFNQKIRRIDKNPAFGIMPRNTDQTFAL